MSALSYAWNWIYSSCKPAILICLQAQHKTIGYNINYFPILLGILLLAINLWSWAQSWVSVLLTRKWLARAVHSSVPPLIAVDIIKSNANMRMKLQNTQEWKKHFPYHNHRIKNHSSTKEDKSRSCSTKCNCKHPAYCCFSCDMIQLMHLVRVLTAL